MGSKKIYILHSSKQPPRGTDEVPSSKNQTVDDFGEPTDIAASFDAGWQKRGTGRAYNSLSGWPQVAIIIVAVDHIMRALYISSYLIMQVIRLWSVIVRKRCWVMLCEVRRVPCTLVDMLETTTTAVRITRGARNRWSQTWLLKRS